MAIFEVLSDETVDRDLGPKLADYLRLPSINRYVTIDQRQVAINSRERTPSGCYCLIEQYHLGIREVSRIEHDPISASP